MIYTHVVDEAQREASGAVWRRLKSAAAQIQAEKNTVSLKVAGKVAEDDPEEVNNGLSY